MTVRLTLSAALACLLLVATAGSASGSAFYNESESRKPNPMSLTFTCGAFCTNHWFIPVGGTAARPGKGGHFGLFDSDSFTGQPGYVCEQDHDHPAVQDHGWAELHYRNGTYQWDLYGEDQNPVSGSPFAFKWTKGSGCGTPVGLAE